MPVRSDLMRVTKSIGLVLLVALCLALAWLVPAYVRALDAGLVKRAGENGRTVVDAGLTLLQLEQSGAAELHYKVAASNGLARAEVLGESLRQYQDAHPGVLPWGGADPLLERLISTDTAWLAGESPPAMVNFLDRRTRAAVLAHLASSRRPGVRAILDNRRLTNTLYFPPVRSASGQPLDAVILMNALLHQEDKFQPPMRAAIEELAGEANRTGNSQAVEQYYLNFMSLSRRLSWAPFSRLLERVQSPTQLGAMAGLTQSAGDRLPVLYAALLSARDTGGLIRYLGDYGAEGFRDVEFALTQGEGALDLVVEKHVRVYRKRAASPILARAPVDTLAFSFLRLTEQLPWAGLYFKYMFLLFAAGGMVQLVVTLVPQPSDLERPLQLKRYGFARQAVFALAVSLLLIALAEPFLFSNNQPVPLQPVWRFPTVSAAIVDQVTKPIEKYMDQITIVAISVFLLLQVILYIVCLLRVAEIKKQPVSSDLKMKLLDNEENMFDAGLYVGLGGTVLALVFLALNIIKPSLMAAYSSTLFGIVFVALVKICHVRPFRRRLILETEFQG